LTFFLSIFVPRLSQLGSWWHIAEPFGSDLKLQAVNKLRDEADETGQPLLALRELCSVSGCNRINTMDKTCGLAGQMNAACTLALETLGNLEENSRTLESKVVFERGE
jgi:hypothetical protein